MHVFGGQRVYVTETCYCNFRLIMLGFNDTSNLVDHFYRLLEKGRKEIEAKVEEMKEKEREERETEMKGKKQKK